MAIAVVDYCKGNLRSVQKGLEAAGAEAFISSDPKEIAKAQALVLPGVGAFADAAQTMNSTGQMSLLREMIKDGVPFLGICLGIHLLFEWGEEGASSSENLIAGLGVLPGVAKRLSSESPDGSRLKIPHVGWNTVELIKPDCPIFDGIPNSTHFYFTHSYVAIPAEAEDMAATTTHGQAFTSVVWNKNIYGVQFHPEKSSAAGMRVLSNFVRSIRSPFRIMVGGITAAGIAAGGITAGGIGDASRPAELTPSASLQIPDGGIGDTK